MKLSEEEIKDLISAGWTPPKGLKVGVEVGQRWRDLDGDVLTVVAVMEGKVICWYKGSHGLYSLDFDLREFEDFTLLTNEDLEENNVQ